MTTLNIVDLPSLLDYVVIVVVVLVVVGLSNVTTWVWLVLYCGKLSNIVYGWSCVVLSFNLSFFFFFEC
ncbi:hypothetical protein F4811DRAFT_499961 [Daldinia bambusicola]|nr:hypothetical protein F4811DRAFT_499961 [Daldinia bambusicola]